MYPVAIDFDFASAVWRQNKRKIGEGHFTYICGHETKKGTPCNNKPMKDNICCYMHNKNNLV